MIAFPSINTPLSAKNINGLTSVYRFAPLSSDDSLSIYSADVSLWGLNGDRSKFFHPSQRNVESWLIHSKQSNIFFVAALCAHEEFSPPGCRDEGIRLTSWDHVLQNTPADDLKKIGYDVIDSWTGISALCNIGYDKADLIEINKLGIGVNDCGLLNSVGDANIFCDLASDIAPDHFPYEVVEIYARTPSR